MFNNEGRNSLLARRNPVRKQDQTRNKIDQNLSFSLAVLVVQLYKYSSYIYETVTLKVTFQWPGHSKAIKLNFAISGYESFHVLKKKVQKEIEPGLKSFLGHVLTKTHISWLNRPDKPNVLMECSIGRFANDNICPINFSSFNSTFFSTDFRKKDARTHYEALASQVHVDPEYLIGDLSCLSGNQFKEIESIAYGQIDHSQPDPCLLHEIFEETAKIHPNKTAIFYNNISMSYRELNEKAIRLSGYLVQHKVRPGDFVGILLDRIPETYIAMLGILKAGAAYVPIDSGYPVDRVRYILEDASIKCLISHTSFESNCAHYSGTILNIDRELATVLSTLPVPLSQSNPRVLISRKSPAYIIYTSGSTGRPKGVVICHSSVTNLVNSEKNLFNLSPEDHVLQGFSVAFDASIEEIWLAFATGATLFPAPKHVMCSGEELSKFINREKITVLSTVPTVLAMIEPPLPSLRLIILGGEACSHDLLLKWNRSGLRMVNTYGPTEATVIATYTDFNPDEKLTIGKPITNYGVFITDAAQQPLPIGIPGELCIVGNGLSLGYLNRDEQTAEKFIDAPFPVQHGLPPRLYRTGDLARFNETGEIEFLGRIDSQVKLRGFRIELAEIEAQICQFRNVRNVAAAIKEDQNGERLVAYVIPEDAAHGFEESACKDFLKKRLAPYMIPALFITMQEFPTLPSGKTDRKKLPLPDLETPPEKDQATKPRTSNEQHIHQVWEELFSPQQVSVTDDFFLDLGGHSLLAARMVSKLRLQSKFQNTSVADVYEHPTIEQLSKKLEVKPETSQNGQSVHRKSSKEQYIPSLFRHFWCGVVQFFSLYFMCGFNVFMDVVAYVVFFYFYFNGHSLPESLGWALGSAVVTYPVLILLAVGLKWLLLGKIKAGRYKLWGGFYIRWWFVQHLIQSLHLNYFSGTTILPILYRMLGMKVGRDVHLETHHFASFDRISIGDGSSIEEDAVLSGYSVSDGYLHIGSITIGENCFIGTRSVLTENTIMQDGARLTDLSLLPSGSIVPAKETWEGAPAKFRSKQDGNIKRAPGTTRFHRISVTALYVLLIFVLPTITYLSFIPGITLLVQFEPLEQPLIYLAMLPLVGASFVVLLTTEVTLLKWLLVGRVKPGTYRVHSGFYIRHWIVTQLLKISYDHVGQLHATLHIAPWYRALGMKVGKFVELSTASSSTPDLISLSDESTIADEVSLGTPHVEGGWMTIAPVTLGQRSFIGNSGVAPVGTELGAGSLVGVLSIAPEPDRQPKDRATWFGSPPRLFPRRERSPGFSEAKTYRPSMRLRVARGTFELLRITFPASGFMFVAVSMIVSIFKLWLLLGPGLALLLSPVVYLISCVVVLLGVALTKWLVVGRYKPFTKPLWNNFVWRLEFVNALYEFLAAPLFLQMLEGTPFLPWYLRLLGSQIGKACYIDTTGFLEWDLVKLGDRVALGEHCVMQSHLFEDRILKASRLRIGNDCSVGAASVVLYNTRIEDGAQLDALSLLMKGETLPAETQWEGIPATRKTTIHPLSPIYERSMDTKHAGERFPGHLPVST